MVLIEDHCYHCGKDNDSLYQCSLCKIVSYCSKVCERKHKKEHSKVCFTAETPRKDKIDSPSDKYTKPKVACSNDYDELGEEHIDFCQGCYKTNVPLQRCSRCKITYYCSRWCQKVDWPAHRMECEFLSKCEEEMCFVCNGGSNRKEKCVNVEEEEKSKTEDKVKSKKTKKRNKKKKHNNDKCDSMKTDKASCKIDTVNEKSKEDSGAAGAKKDNNENMNCNGKDGNMDSKKMNSKNKTNPMKSKTDVKEAGKKTDVKNAGKKTDVKETGKKTDFKEAGKKTDVKNAGKKTDVKDAGKKTDVKEAGKKTDVKDAGKKTDKDADKETGEKTDKDAGKKTDAGPSVESKAGKCGSCGNYKEKLMICGRCKNAKYCSRDCQKAAWPLHKTSCKSPSKLNPTILSKQDRLQKCLLKAERMFPLHNIITSFEEVGAEYQYINWMDDTVLVAYILRPAFHCFRQSFFIQDTDGSEIFLIFYHEESDPYPYFSWDDLKVGNFICIIEPELHYFMDGQIGFRINSTKEVRIL